MPDFSITQFIQLFVMKHSDDVEKSDTNKLLLIRKKSKP